MDDADCMNILLLSDLHLVSPSDPHLDKQRQRRHFVGGRKSLPALRRAIEDAAPDVVISLGDLVDWYSDENRDYALAFLESLGCPWHFTPGNHDAASPGEGVPAPGLGGWEAAGVAVHNRKLTLGPLEAWLINSHNSAVPEGTGAWLQAHLNPEAVNAVFTHVPPDVPETCRAILDCEPHRDLNKYVQRGAPGLFARSLEDKVDAVFSGHLHFAAQATRGRTQFHILPLSLHALDKVYPQQGRIHLLDSESLACTRIQIEQEKAR